MSTPSSNDRASELGPSRHHRRAQWLILAALVSLCPVLITDFLVSAGIVPLSYVFLAALLWMSPLVMLLYWMVIPYFVAFYFLSRWLVRRCESRSTRALHPAWRAIPAALAILSLFPVYVPLSHGRASAVNILSLFNDGFRGVLSDPLTEESYIRRFPADWARGWSDPRHAGQVLYVCTGPPLIPIPSQPRVRQTWVMWEREPTIGRRAMPIEWGIEPAPEYRTYLEKAVASEFRRVTPRVAGPGDTLARLIRGAVETRHVEPPRFGAVTTETGTYSCIHAQYPWTTPRYAT
ncbi:MAG: hypothetical protein ACREX4_13220 [Gammaproteobacteria bacterium]